jgi:hypothetical protein
MPDKGQPYLMIPLTGYPTYTNHMMEFYVKNPSSIRMVNHPGHAFECDEVVDLDEMEDWESEA